MTRLIPDALSAADTLAARLAIPPTGPGTGRGQPQSLGGGAAGIALLHIERARSGHGDAAIAHAWLAAAARDALSAGPNAALYFGAPALAFVIHAAADRSNRYVRAISNLDPYVVTLTFRRVAAANARLDRGERPLLAEFDLIRGLAGFGAYHLHRHPDHTVTRAVLAYLVRLTEPIAGEDDGLPGWWTEVSPNGAASPDFPGGHGNHGMSHGIAAPLALLSLALRAGVVVAGHSDAIARICGWLDTWQQDHPAGTWWPGYVTRAQADGEQLDLSRRHRPSWCYGTPGVARAMQLAALAAGDTARQRIAEAAMLGCLRDLSQLDCITGTGLCHGTAGVLQTAWRMAADAATPELAAELPHLTTRLLTQLPDEIDNPEFLDGAAGVALALHTAGTGTAPLSLWDACLLLA